MKRQEISLTTPKRTYNVPALVSKYFGVHKGIYIRGDESLGFRKSYAVTHIPTGLALSDSLSLKKARETVAALESLSGIDWNKPMEYWLSESGYKIVSEKIRPLVNRIKFS